MKWGIVGGGVLGLTMALRLRKEGQEVVLFEREPITGGLARTWEYGPIHWDRYYHVILLSDSYTRAMLRDLDIESQITWVETKTGMYANGRLSSLSNAVEYLRLPVLNLFERFRLALTILYASRIQDWQTLEKIPVEQWLSRLSGRSTFHKLWRPLLIAKLGESWQQTSASFIWATIQRLYAARQSGLKKEMFGYLPGGYATVFQRFEEYLGEIGVAIRAGQPVQQVEKRAGGFVIHPGSGEIEECDRVVMTCSNSIIAKLCPQLDPQERTLLAQTPYQGIVCASVLLKKPLADYYLTYLMDEGLPFTAVVEMTAFVDRSQTGGNALVYLPRYIDARHPFFQASDKEVEESFLAALERMYPHFRRDDVLAFQVGREAEVFPVPVLEYSKKAPPLRSSVPGLFFATSAQIVRGTLNVNDSVRIAETAVAELLGSEAGLTPSTAEDNT